MAKEIKKKRSEKSPKQKEKEKMVEESSEPKTTSYTYEAIMASKGYSGVQRDLLAVILEPAQCYTLAQIEGILDQERKRKVL